MELAFHPAALAEFYEVTGEKLWVWAVMHAAREPGYWKTLPPK